MVVDNIHITKGEELNDGPKPKKKARKQSSKRKLRKLMRRLAKHQANSKVKIPQYLREDFPNYSKNQEEKKRRRKTGSTRSVKPVNKESEAVRPRFKPLETNEYGVIIFSNTPKKEFNTPTAPKKQKAVKFLFESVMPRPQSPLSKRRTTVTTLRTHSLSVKESVANMRSSSFFHLNVANKDAFEELNEPDIGSEVKSIQLSVIPAAVTSQPARRINKKIMALKNSDVLESFLKRVKALEEHKANSKLNTYLIRRNINMVTKYIFSDIIKMRREELKKHLETSIMMANIRKHRLLHNKIQNIHMKVHKKEIKAMRQRREMIACQRKTKWLVLVGFASRLECMKKLIKSLKQRRMWRNAAITIQTLFRYHQRRKERRKHKHSHFIIVKFVVSWSYKRRKFRQEWAADAIYQFLLENGRNFAKLFKFFRFRVIKCQRYARQFIACTQARVLALSKIWVQQERVYADAVREMRLRKLKTQALNLLNNVRNTGQYQKLGENKSLRGISVPRLSDGSKIENVSRQTLHFPSGGQYITEVESYGKERKKSLMINRYHASTYAASVKSKYQSETRLEHLTSYQHRAMDVFLSDVLQKQLKNERAKAVHVEVASKELRNRALLGIIAERRKRHQKELVKMKREQIIRDSQKLKMGTKDAIRLLRDDEGSQIVTKTIFSKVARTPVMKLYSTIKPDDIMRLVQKAHLQ